MQEQLAKFMQWLEDASERERQYFLIGALFVLFLLWYGALGSFLASSHKTLLDNLQTTTQQISDAQQQVDALVKANAIGSNATLQQQLDQQNAQLNVYFKELANSQAAMIATKTLLTPGNGIVLAHVTNSLPTVVQASGQNNSQKLFEHAIVLEFRGNYAATLEYLQLLETLPWYFFYDELDYQVVKYPQAKITLKLHVLSFQENLLDV